MLVNSNPATIMTDGDMADAVYLEPLNLETVKRIIEKEKPDSLLAGIGGQTGLTLAMQLSKEGFLAEHGVRLIGTTAEAIDKSEDRQLFKDAMAKIGQPTIPSGTARDLETAIRTARRVGYPVIVRPAFTLGGAGGGIAQNEDALRLVAANGLDASPISQVLIEKYIFGWKEIEFEVMRDGAGNVITICSMENMDPVGIHTGDSIVVAPALTLADREFQMLRCAALAIIEELGIEGGCNCQFALNPDSFEYAVIEVNPRVSRSSALASKATGYPIAKVAVKIALGYTLDEIRNDITGETFACFEPTIDYVVVKFPKWPFDKFYGSSRELGPQMKATGEVMAIGLTFEAALMKAVRGAEIKQDTLNRRPTDRRPLRERLRTKDDLRLFTIFEALKNGWSTVEVSAVTRIDRWFIEKIKNLADFEAELARSGLTDDTYLRGKVLGYPDAALLRLSPGGRIPPRQPLCYKMVDTCAGEFVAKTPYFYSVYGGHCDARTHRKPAGEAIVVLGSGPIRIGQGIEFDYSSVHCVRTLKEMGYTVVIINNNPETVSTDYDTADRLYFEPLCPEDVMGVIAVEKPVGVVVAFGGQTAISLAEYLVSQGITILGTSAEGIDLAEDRGKFDNLLESLGVSRPRGLAVHSASDAEKAAADIGYPVLVRPSYVIGGQNMVIAYDSWDVRRYASVILSGDADNAVLIDKYMPGTELEADVISDGRDVLIPGIMEHIERAGIHSGDSIAVYPPSGLSEEILATVADRSEKLALALGTKGLVNIQYLVYQNELYVIEVNPRASRTVPYLSKITGVPMADIATRVMMGVSLREMGYKPGLCPTVPYFGVKAPVFSFEKLPDANSLLGPEMKSTGEVLGVARTRSEAIYKALRAAGYSCRLSPGREKKGVLLSLDNRQFSDLPQLASRLDAMGLRIFATPDTAAAVKALGIYAFDIGAVCSITELRPLMEKTGLILVVYTGALHDDTMGDYIKLHGNAVRLGIPCITSVDTARTVLDIMASGLTDEVTQLIDINRIVHPAKTGFGTKP